MLADSAFVLSDARRMLQPPGPPPSGGGGGTPLSTTAGIALSGGYIYNSLAGGNTDAVEGELDTLDVCISHPAPSGDLHYHYWGGCLVKDYGFWDDSEAPALCADVAECTSDTPTYLMNKAKSGQTSFYVAGNWDKPIGLALDGHLIMGPYKEDGTTWGCSRDVCNGAFIGDQYVYVGSDKFPYVVGCWGPGPEVLYQPGCTSSACGTLAAQTQSTDGAASLLAFASVLTAVSMVAL